VILRHLKRPLTGLAAALVAAVSLAAASSALADAKLSLVAYSTPQEAYEAIIPAFEKTPAGKGLSFDQSYGASGDQARAVRNGLSADVVALSLEPDVKTLVDQGLVARGWNRGKYHGMVTRSVVVFVVRKGNPRHIRSWNDLVKPGIDVITPNALTSGGARWNVMAAYGAQRKLGRTDRQAQDYLRALYKHVSVQDKSARESLQTFAGGKGDVLLAYENEAIFAKQQGIALDYVIPGQTILIENPVAVTTESKNPKAARAFIDFLRSRDAQFLFGTKGYRPVVKEVANLKKFRKEYPKPPGLFDIGVLGGWDYVQKAFFDPQNGVIVKVQRN
jgi:sulfate transport system substrate-binding protein